MVPSNILFRTFFIRSAQYGTAFTLDVGGEEYLITARHLLPTEGARCALQIFHAEKWVRCDAIIVARGRGEIDIAVLKLPSRITPRDLPVSATCAELTLGHEMFFLGFPYNMWGKAGEILAGKPMPFAKRGTLSLIDVSHPQTLYVDAINNRGFSGGPIFFYAYAKPKELRVAGVVSKFKVENERVVGADGIDTGSTVEYNTGFLIAYGIKHALELIPENPNA